MVLRRTISYLTFSAFLIGLSQTSAADFEELLGITMSGGHRSSNYVERDQYRHPKETLMFFGVKATDSVVEITPGMGYYTEILAPVLAKNGVYYPASYELHPDINPFFVRLDKDFKEKLAGDQANYGAAKWIHFDPNQPNFAPDGPVDVVLTFRNVHNWAKAGTAEWMFDGFAKALKPGGVLGLVEHRAKPGTPFQDQIRTGYMTVEYVVQMAKDAGFRLDASSEINANPKDTKDYPGGVWNLLPNLRNVPEEDKARLAAIGESDRMTLRFIKE